MLLGKERQREDRLKMKDVLGVGLNECKTEHEKGKKGRLYLLYLGRCAVKDGVINGSFLAEDRKFVRRILEASGEWPLFFGSSVEVADV